MDASTRLALLAGAAMFLGLMAAAGYMLLRDMRGQERYGSRIRQIHREERVRTINVERPALRDTLSGLVSRVGQAILSGGLVPAATRGQLETMLRGAGVRGENAVGVFFGAKMGLLVILPVIGWLLVHNSGWSTMVIMFVPFAAGVFGLMLPDIVVKQMRKRFMA